MTSFLGCSIVRLSRGGESPKGEKKMTEEREDRVKELIQELKDNGFNKYEIANIFNDCGYVSLTGLSREEAKYGYHLALR